jgi:hypothetical protein
MGGCGHGVNARLGQRSASAGIEIGVLVYSRQSLPHLRQVLVVSHELRMILGLWNDGNEVIVTRY